MNSTRRSADDVPESAGHGPTDHWFAALQEGRLLYQTCEECTATVYYPRLMCPTCGSDRLTDRGSSGTGSIYATTAVHSRAGTRNVVLVDVDEGFRMMSSVRGVDPGSVTIGLRVALEVIEEDGCLLPVFRPAESPTAEDEVVS